MSSIYEFIKETNHDGESKWHTIKDGRYVGGSLSFNEEDARKLFEIAKKRGTLDPVREVIETCEIINHEEI